MIDEFAKRPMICGECGDRFEVYADDRRPRCRECVIRQHIHSRFTSGDTDIAQCVIPECNQMARWYIPAAICGPTYDLSPYYYCHDCRNAAGSFTFKSFRAFDPYEWV